MSRLFTSESVTEGHPDKLADQISDAVVDAILAKDPEQGRVACETLLAKDLVIVAGEIRESTGDREESGDSGPGRSISGKSSSGGPNPNDDRGCDRAGEGCATRIDVVGIVRETLLAVGYDRPEYGIDAAGCKVLVALHGQSAEIAGAVDARKDVDSRKEKSTGAGDQGMMFGYACDDIPGVFMPAPIATAHALVRRLAEVRKSNRIPWLRPDGKSQVTFEYDDDGAPRRIHTIVLSAQHDEGVGLTTIESALEEHVIRPVLAREEFARFHTGCVKFRINTSGAFTKGGPDADAGLTGRKIIVDTYGGMGRHGGGAFSGKDPTKVDRSGAYAARWAAKNIVAAKLARRCEVQLAYAIGEADPVQIRVDTFGTAARGLDDRAINEAVGKVFRFTPDAIREALELNAPIYGPTAVYGHFGRTSRSCNRDGRELRLFGWERTDRVDRLKEALKAR